MTGRGFRDESCSRGLSTVTVEETNVRFLRHRLKKGKKKTKKTHTHLPAFSPVHIRQQAFFSINPRRDVSNDTFLELTVEPSLFYFITLPF